MVYNLPFVEFVTTAVTLLLVNVMHTLFYVATITVQTWNTMGNILQRANTYIKLYSQVISSIVNDISQMASIKYFSHRRIEGSIKGLQMSSKALEYGMIVFEGFQRPSNA